VIAGSEQRSVGAIAMHDWWEDNKTWALPVVIGAAIFCTRVGRFWFCAGAAFFSGEGAAY
jgi:hypothetical protein